VAEDFACPTVEKGCSVWGVVYHIKDEQQAALDKAEGVGIGAYKHFTVDVHPEGDHAQRIKAVTYVVVNKEDPRPKPSAAYKQLISGGAKHWKLPAQYIAQLERIEVA
jgi:cation transport regulator ChaC